MKICILSLYKSENLGEMAYTECIQKLIRKRLPNVEIELLDIHGRDADKKYKESILTKIFRKLHLTTLEKRCFFSGKAAFLKKYYSERVSGSDAVVVPGGGYIKCTPRSLKDRSYRYNEYFSIMADVCEKNSIGFYLNAVGHTINGNEENEYNAWKQTFSKPSIRYVSCRDEIDFFKEVRQDSRLVCCSAAYAAELFNVKRKEISELDSGKKIIGIGVIREDAFSDYGFSITGEELISFYVKLVDFLEDRGYEVRFFTNGLKRDQLFGDRITEVLGRKDMIIARPEKVEELIDTISQFHAVIVSRMHAAIIAYSFGIPAVCLCWNNKHREFLSYAGVPEWAIYPKDFEPTRVGEILEQSMREGWPKEKMDSYRITALQSVDLIIDDILKSAER